jgi:succinoglycan biosynthesis transport protein ExoP
MPDGNKVQREIAPVELVQPAQGINLAVPLTMQEAWRILVRRKWFILFLTLLITVVAAFSIFSLKSQYTAETSVLINERHPQVVRMDLTPLQPIDAEAIQTETQVIRSRNLIGRVVDKLGLVGNPLFNGSLQPKSFLGEAREATGVAVSEALDRLGIAPLKVLPPATPEQVRSDAIDEVLQRLEVGQEGKSRAIKLKLTTPDAAVSALVLSTIADFYVTSTLEAKFDERARAAKWLNERLTDLKDQARAADTAVEDYRRTAQLSGGAAGTPAAEQITQLNAQLITARADRAQAEANMRQAQKLIATSADANAINQVLQSPTIQQLEAQEADISRRIADLSAVYGDRHPRLASAQAELAQMRKKIRSEAEKIVSGMDNQVASARAKEASLLQGVSALQTELARQNAAQVKLRALEEEANADRALLDTFLARSKELSPDGSFETTDAQVISKAEEPRLPSFPKRSLLLAVAFVVATFMASTTAYAVERLDDRLRSSDQVQELLGVTPLGIIPNVGGAKKSISALLKQPTSAFGESLLNLHTALMLSNVDSPTRVVLITSSLPGEGKTTVSVSLGRILARNGYKVLIIDCDMRRPTAHSIFGVAQTPGLTDLLMGRAAPEAAFKQDPESPAVLLPAGSDAPNPQTIIASAQMRSLVGDMRENFDLILIDSPPIFAVSDAKILSALADKTVYICRWGATRSKIVKAGLRQLREARADIAGVLLTAVDVSKHARYSFTDSGLYHGKLKSYYGR